MVRTSSAEHCLSEDDRDVLRSLAARVIQDQAANGREAAPDPNAYAPTLREPRACFVTLNLDGELRGCVGCLEPSASLVEEVARAAHNAAFRDPRFSPVTRHEAPRLDIHISVLSTPEPMSFVDENDLVAQLRPHIDGLIVRDGSRSGTFLPAVWDNFPDPAMFLRQLKRKAGLSMDHWSSNLVVERYVTESF